MHIEFLIEDSSGARLVEQVLPKLLGLGADAPTYRLHAFRGIGRLPLGLGKGGDPAKRILLDQLPRLLRAYGKTPGIDAVVVVIDSDQRDCRHFLNELKALLATIERPPSTLFRLAIEETEAWLLGDRQALLAAYPRAKISVLDAYRQDSVCGTWELLADAVFPGGEAKLRKAGWPRPGQVKHEWADRIGARLEPSRNASPSFRKFVAGLARVVAGSQS